MFSPEMFGRPSADCSIVLVDLHDNYKILGIGFNAKFWIRLCIDNLNSKTVGLLVLLTNHRMDFEG
jgi:hypothetical protein